MTRQQRLARMKERYLRDGYPRRLGGLAANLARVASFSDDSRHQGAVTDLIVESEHMIEWVAPTAPSRDQERLVQLQRDLASWHRRIGALWLNEAQRREVAGAARRSADEVLGMSGLLSASGGS
jgi:hypothetical protein